MFNIIDSYESDGSNLYGYLKNDKKIDDISYDPIIKDRERVEELWPSCEPVCAMSPMYSVGDPLALKESLHKKRILVLANSGGGGHKSAADALQRSLGDKYDIQVDYTYDKIGGSEFYNYFVKSGNSMALGLMTSAQPLAEKLIVPLSVKSDLAKKIVDYKPDLIISAFPVANSHTWDLAKAGNIPMLVLTTDLYCRHFFNNIEHPGSNFKVGIPFDSEWIKNQLTDKFDEENFVTTGYPLRPEFGYSEEVLNPKIEEIRHELQIRREDKVVLIMMGAQGSGNAIVEYCRKIASDLTAHGNTLHVVALCGKNEELKKDTEAVGATTLNSQVKIHALESKNGDYIAALMRMGHVLVSKPGGSTVNEGIASGIYMLLDDKALKGALPWEGGNLQFAVSHGYGEEINDEEFLNQLNRVLEKPRAIDIDCPGRAFDLRIQNVVNNLMESAPQNSTDWEEYRLSVDPLASMKYYIDSSLSSLSFEIENIREAVAEKINSIYDFQGSSTNPKVTYDSNVEKLLQQKESRLFDLGKLEVTNIQIGFINGILNDFESAMKSVEYISQLAEDYNVHGVYNATRGLGADLLEYVSAQNHVAGEPVHQLHKLWDNFFAQAPEGAKFLQICHSIGATHVRNALLDYPEELRERILVLAVAPASYIYPNTCGNAVHFRTKEASRDFIAHIPDIWTQEIENIIELPSKEGAETLDHRLKSPTYKQALSSSIFRYLESGGKKLLPS